jgi:hypothetical protein
MTRTVSFHIAAFTLAALTVAIAFAPLLRTAAAIVS